MCAFDVSVANPQKAHIHAAIRTHQAHKQAHIHTYINACIHAHMHIYMHTYKHKNTKPYAKMGEKD